MPAAEIRVFGPVEVVRADGGVVPLAAMQTRLLAGLVVTDGRACGPDELVDTLWKEPSPAWARKLVQVYVSQLRKALPTGIEIVTQGGAYARLGRPGGEGQTSRRRRHRSRGEQRGRTRGRTRSGHVPSRRRRHPTTLEQVS